MTVRTIFYQVLTETNLGFGSLAMFLDRYTLF